MSIKDKMFIRRAIELAQKGMQKGDGGPFGAVIVKDDKIIGEGWNCVTSSNDPTAHAEVVAIRAACKNIDSFQLEGCTIYASCEPCPMCFGAIYWARPDRLVYAATKIDAAEIAGFDDAFIYEQLDKPEIERHIKQEQLLREEGLAPFEVWRAKENKDLY